MNNKTYAQTENYERKKEDLENFNTRLNMYLLGIDNFNNNKVPDYDLFEYNDENNKLLIEVIKIIQLKLKGFKFFTIESKNKIINDFHKSMKKYMELSNIDLIKGEVLNDFNLKK